MLVLTDLLLEVYYHNHMKSEQFIHKVYNTPKFWVKRKHTVKENSYPTKGLILPTIHDRQYSNTYKYHSLSTRVGNIRTSRV